VRGAVSDRSIVRLHTGDAAAVALQALPEGGSLAATISELAIAASPPLGTFEIELRLDAANARHPALRAGMVADLTIQPTPVAHYALIPAAALRDGDGTRAAVWVVAGDRQVTRMPVTVAYFTGEDAALSTGLPEGAQVVVQGAAYLTPTSEVRVVATGAAK
jgi:multidrug efflux pump subunit AcrA (membrane-fusion protein)